MEELRYVRFQGRRRLPDGTLPGVFHLVDGPARAGGLTAEQERFRRRNNDWYDAAYPDPTDHDPTVYDRVRNPRAVAWFKSTSLALIARVDGCPEILAAHGVPCDRLVSTDPGRIVHEDAHQVVAVPWPADGPGRGPG